MVFVNSILEGDLAMPNPWDAPPLPSRADDNENETFAAVGRVVSGWKQLNSNAADFTVFLKTTQTAKQCAATVAVPSLGRVLNYC